MGVHPGSAGTGSRHLLGCDAKRAIGRGSEYTLGPGGRAHYTRALGNTAEPQMVLSGLRQVCGAWIGRFYICRHARSVVADAPQRPGPFG